MPEKQLWRHKLIEADSSVDVKKKNGYVVTVG